MKQESLADLGYIKLYLNGFIKDNVAKLPSDNPKEYNLFSLRRCIELVEEIVAREMVEEVNPANVAMDIHIAKVLNKETDKSNV